MPPFLERRRVPGDRFGRIGKESLESSVMGFQSRTT